MDTPPTVLCIGKEPMEHPHSKSFPKVFSSQINFALGHVLPCCLQPPGSTWIGSVRLSCCPGNPCVHLMNKALALSIPTALGKILGMEISTSATSISTPSISNQGCQGEDTENEVRDDFGHELWKQSKELTLNSLLQVEQWPCHI